MAEGNIYNDLPQDDEQFRGSLAKKFAQSEAAPAPNAWDKIAAEIAVPNNKKPLAWFWWLPALLLLFSGMGYLIGYKAAEKTIPSTLATAETTKNIQKTNQAPEKEGLTQSIATEKEIQSSTTIVPAQAEQNNKANNPLSEPEKTSQGIANNPSNQASNKQASSSISRIGNNPKGTITTEENSTSEEEHSTQPAAIPPKKIRATAKPKPAKKIKDDELDSSPSEVVNSINQSLASVKQNTKSKKSTSLSASRNGGSNSVPPTENPSKVLASLTEKTQLPSATLSDKEAENVANTPSEKKASSEIVKETEKPSTAEEVVYAKETKKDTVFVKGPKKDFIGVGTGAFMQGNQIVFGNSPDVGVQAYSMGSAFSSNRFGADFNFFYHRLLSTWGAIRVGFNYSLMQKISTINTLTGTSSGFNYQNGIYSPTLIGEQLQAESRYMIGQIQTQFLVNIPQSKRWYIHAGLSAGRVFDTQHSFSRDGITLNQTEWEAAYGQVLTPALAGSMSFGLGYRWAWGNNRFLTLEPEYRLYSESFSQGSALGQSRPYWLGLRISLINGL